MSDKLLDFVKLTPGPANLISDLDGILVGNAEDAAAITGVSVVPEAPCVAGCAVPGGGPGTRETDALQPANLVDRVDAVCLSGGSVYGLDAASAVTAELGAEGRGFAMGAPPVASPIVPAAILFDIGNGGAKDWGDTPPYHRLGKQAFDARARHLRWAIAEPVSAHKPVSSRAGSAVPAPCSTQMCVSAHCWRSTPSVPCAMPKAHSGSSISRLTMKARRSLAAPMRTPRKPEQVTRLPLPKLAGLAAGANTTIGVVAVAADLTPAECQRVAIMAQDGLARAIRPMVHTPFDGDTIFVLATGSKQKQLWQARHEMRPLALTVLGALAADCVARAIARAVWFADDTGFAPAYRSRFPIG